MPTLTHHPWKVLSSEYLFQDGPWLRIRHEVVELPNGIVIPTWYIMDFPTWINVIAITRDWKYVMESQYRHGIGETHYELCAGVVEDGEQPLAAAKRELMEETGYSGGQWEEWMRLCPNPTNHSNWSITFVARGVEKQEEAHQESTEDIETHLLSESELKEVLESGDIVQALHAAPLWKWFAKQHNT